MTSDAKASETPRSDAYGQTPWPECIRQDHLADDKVTAIVILLRGWFDLSRDLERELTAATSRAAAAEKLVNDLHMRAVENFESAVNWQERAAADAEDAARYRWLRDMANDGDWKQVGELPADRPAEIDAFIDEASHVHNL